MKNLLRFSISHQFKFFCRKYATKPHQKSRDPLLQPNPVSKALQTLSDRYLLAATFPDTFLKDLSKFDALPAKVYLGVDPTSTSLHIGNLISLNALLQLYGAGFEVFVLIGGATCKLGDPSGRYTDRQPIDWDTVKQNSESIQEQTRRLFENYSKHFYKGDTKLLKPVRFINNIKWYESVNVIDFLDQNGRLFRVKHLLEKQAIKSRLTSSGMNLNEFLYQIFQAYDFLKLHDEHGCLLQLGGTDQIGNVHAGHDLIKKMRQTDAFGIFSPLMTDEKGEKLGKSAGNSVALCPKLFSPFKFYQHFCRLHDTVLHKHFCYLTNLPVQEVDRLCESHMKCPEKRIAQKTLAELVTTLVHGKEGLEAAVRTTNILYQNEIEHLLKMTPEEIDLSFNGVPTVQMAFRLDVKALELVLATKFFGSEQEAEQWVRRGAVQINGTKVQEPMAVMVRDCHVLSNGLTLIKFGKKDFYLVRWFGM